MKTSADQLKSRKTGHNALAGRVVLLPVGLLLLQSSRRGYCMRS